MNDGKKIFWRLRLRILSAIPRKLRAPPVLAPVFLAIGLGGFAELFVDERFAHAPAIEVLMMAIVTAGITLYALVLLLALARPPEGFEVNN